MVTVRDSGRGWTVGPQLVDQILYRHQSSGSHDQQGKYGPLLGRTQVYWVALDQRLKITQDSNLHQILDDSSPSARMITLRDHGPGGTMQGPHIPLPVRMIGIPLHVTLRQPGDGPIRR
ncbi:hypothetical protein [Micromonospora sp. U56]|uniref:hypothetical protein n=1 Tax=Micromonospora sp. U56 TaxID=2824900 RepID=UPI0035A8FE63